MPKLMYAAMIPPETWAMPEVMMVISSELVAPARKGRMVSGASVTGTVLRQAKDKKILVFRYKPKKRVRKLNGHRQPFAEVKITKITLP